LKAWGLTREDMWLDGRKARQKERTEENLDLNDPDAIYDYTDKDSNLKYQSLRYQLGGTKKTFRQRRPDPDKPDEWIWNIDGIEHYLYHLPEIIAAIARGTLVCYVEGEKDTNNLRKLGLCATCHSGGARYWNDSLISQLAGADLVVIPDKDKAGMTLLENVCRAAQGVVKRLRVLIIPGDAKDITDWIEEGHNKADLDAVIAGAPEYDPDKVAELIAQYKGTLPEVVITNQHTRDITARALEALHKQNNPAKIFQRSNTLTRIAVDEEGKPYADTIDGKAFRGCIDRCCDFMRLTKQGDAVATPPPQEVVDDGLRRPELWKSPPLLGIVETPVLRPDGTILTTPGYDENTKLYYHPAEGLEIPLIPDNPSPAQVREAAQLVIDPVYDFPFDCQASWANAIGTMFAPVLRPIIDGCVPMALFDKPQQGTGASLLAEIVSIVSTGREAAMMTAPDSDEEWRKQITSLLVQGKAVATVDNVEGDLRAPSLAALLTLTVWQCRILGQTKNVELPHRTVWIATGNNIHLKGDLPRRCIWIRMDAHVPRPWMRLHKQFKHPKLKRWVMENRGAILAAMLTIARAWVLGGKPIPEGIPILGNFESYCETVGGLLPFMGVRGFLANLDKLYDETDTSTPQWANFFGVWHDLLSDEAYTSAEVVDAIFNNAEFKALLPDDLADAFADGKNYAVRLGKQLHDHVSAQHPNELVLVRAGTKKRAVTWKVEKAPSPTTSPHFTLDGEDSEVSYPLACEKRQINLIDKNSTEDKGATTSPSSPSDTKQGEVTPKKMTPMRIPPYPTAPCRCGCHKFWLRPPLPGKGDSEWICPTCYPPPKHLKGLTWYIVPPPKKAIENNELMGLPLDYPPYPSPCPDCGCDEFWSGEKTWQCCKCNPPSDDGD
jgi:hypothetical protein